MIDRASNRELIADVDLVTRSIRRGVYQAALDHQRDGMPMVVWKNGQIEWVPAEEVLEDLRKADSTLADESRP